MIVASAIRLTARRIVGPSGPITGRPSTSPTKNAPTWFADCRQPLMNDHRPLKR